MVERENSGRDNYNLGALEGWFGSLVWWKVLKIYEGDMKSPNKDGDRVPTGHL